MNVTLIGVNHKTAPLEVRERLAISEDKLPEALRLLARHPGVEEGMIVSTCNRVELYAAGEEPIPGVTGKLLVDALTEFRPHRRVVYLPRRVDVVRFLASEVRPGDLVLTLGAGSVWQAGDKLLAKLRTKE